ncbi:hypothetical protein [Myroides guanonis]|uniref:Uncharacterized protein n=1 Tax=Myroides guanonis TaxID=1150112 RepID=A0A1I3R0U2_9FLAO|nr:hypothetical protein [Myroides guanonis]SFJ40104.1 hypothetical protein SAMN04487893_10714 [Myroides guanonis]
MIKKLSVVVLLLLNTVAVFAQEEVLFKAVFKPNKVYKTYMKTTSYTETDFTGNAAIIEEITKNGVSLPMISDNEMFINLELKTYSSNDLGEFKGVLEYKNMVNNMTVNGQTTDQGNPFLGVKIMGTYDSNNRFSLDTIVGNQLTDQLRDIMKTTAENMQEAVKFPANPLKIGDSFDMDIPMSIPIDGIGTISFIIRTNYLLKEIKGSLAHFDIVQSIELETTGSKTNMSASGEGVGTLDYDIKENYIVRNDVNLPMEMSIIINEDLSLVVKVKSITEQRVVMSKG